MRPAEPAGRARRAPAQRAPPRGAQGARGGGRAVRVGRTAGRRPGAPAGSTPTMRVSPVWPVMALRSFTHVAARLRANGSVSYAKGHDAGRLSAQASARRRGSGEVRRANANQDHRGQRSDRGHRGAAVVPARALGAERGHEQQGPADQEAQNDVNGAAGAAPARRPARRALARGRSPASRPRSTRSPRRRLSARGDAATKRCDDLVSKMKNAPLFERERADARRARRHERQDRRPEQLEPEPRRRPGGHLRRPQGDAHHGAVRARTSGTSKDRYLASYVPVHDDQGKPSGRPRHRPPAQRHAVARERGDDGPRARSSSSPRATGSTSSATRRSRRPRSTTPSPSGAKDMLKNALAHQQTDVVRDGDLLVAAAPLPALEDGKRALLVAAAPASLIQDPTGLALLPIFGVAGPRDRPRHRGRAGCSATTSRGRSTCSRRGSSPSSTARPTSASSSITPSSAASRSGSTSCSTSSWGSRKTRPTPRAACRMAPERGATSPTRWRSTTSG